ncbi:hypothetical protein [Nitrosospira sp. NRS527]|uniref:hypothetical protein n=1 Tax=Nitrosospira sp. NRS527 TaxID=155925 RepID=UPI001AFB2CC7|nr:hypothetical protein [Nitrosospira sp. NRS527]BCT68813.1 hypothetical protein NNRS527_02419 [Nitrosospira sp. NRS527]
MHKLLLISISLLAVVLLALAAALSLAIEDHPRIERQVILTPEHIGRAKRIIDAHRYWVRPGMLAAANITSSDVDLAANYLAHRFGKGSAQVILADGNAVIRLSLPMATIPINGYINLAASVMEVDGKPQLQSVQVGKLMLPDVLTQVLALQFMDWLRQSNEYKAGLDSLKRIKLSRNELGIVYRWAGGFSKGMRASIIDKQERERLLRYQSILAANSIRNEAVMPLSEILPSLIRVAAARSVNEGDALAENRAAILVVAFHVLGVSLKRILPEAANWPRAAPQSITLDGRDDFAKHFMASAAIAAYADTMLSDAIGLYKEIEDSLYGSGFSFNDIAADRAGTKFGEKAVISEASALQLQHRVVSGLKDADLMPLWSDLPEFMSAMEFKQRFGGIDTPAYQGMMQKIEQRVAALRVLQ